VYNEYRKNPKITRTRLYYEMMEEILKNTEDTDLIDKNLKNFIPFKPLNKDKQGGSQ
jgi:membrane protease subunit HflK